MLFGYLIPVGIQTVEIIRQPRLRWSRKVRYDCDQIDTIKDSLSFVFVKENNIYIKWNNKNKMKRKLKHTKTEWKGNWKHSN